MITYKITISGKFTENAMEKLRYKVPREYKRYVEVLDKERVIRLLGHIGMINTTMLYLKDYKS